MLKIPPYSSAQIRLACTDLHSAYLARLNQHIPWQEICFMVYALHRPEGLARLRAEGANPSRANRSSNC